MDIKQNYETVILADGAFPFHEIPLRYLKNARRIICCDGSVKNLLTAGFPPYAIIGDMDSLSDDIYETFHDRIFREEDQETNDLTKAVMWCSKQGFRDLVITGATGKREDHTLGNISLLANYARVVDVFMVTDTGILKPYLKSCEFEAIPGQQVSIFSFDPEMEISSEGLRYPLAGKKLSRWWEATLNEATTDMVSLRFSGGPVIVYMKFNE